MEKVTVQKSYKRSGIVGILGILGIRKTNNLRIINNLVGFDPDQVHHLNPPEINHLDFRMRKSYTNRTLLL